VNYYIVEPDINLINHGSNFNFNFKRNITFTSLFHYVMNDNADARNEVYIRGIEYKTYQRYENNMLVEVQYIVN
jgi:hypothetical protein